MYINFTSLNVVDKYINLVIDLNDLKLTKVEIKIFNESWYLEIIKIIVLYIFTGFINIRLKLS